MSEPVASLGWLLLTGSLPEIALAFAELRDAFFFVGDFLG